MSEIQKSSSEVDQELTQEAQQHIANIEALVQFRALHPEIFATIAPKVKAVLTEGDNPIIPVLSEQEIKEQILTKPRKNKYGLVMDPLEQELENIKLGFLEVKKFDSRENGKESSYDFFMRIYGKYRDAKVIYQADLLSIDKQLLKSLTNFFHRARFLEGQISTLQEFLPNRSERTIRLIKDIEDIGLTRQEISPIALTLIAKH